MSALPGALPRTSRPQPMLPVRGDEGIVIQVRVGGINAVNLLALARAEAFPRVEAPGALK